MSHGQRLLMLLIVNTMIAAILTLLNVPGGFWGNALISHSIGFSTCGLYVLLFQLYPGQPPRALQLAMMPLGVLLGFKLAALAGGFDVLGLIVANPLLHWPKLLSICLITISASTFFNLLERAAQDRAELATQQQQALEARQAETAAKLALLQAQIEPHFLFNTLANVQSLIEHDPPRAKIMLEHLNRYLRASLSRTRKPESLLAEELKLVEALLAIAAIRLGPRLSYQIEVSEELRQLRLPPLLLQPLVENALEHGIEPAIDGGAIRIVGEARNGQLVLTVHDSGIGLNQSDSDGVGLANVRGRLASLYGTQGQLALYANQPHGVVAELALPLPLQRA